MDVFKLSRNFFDWSFENPEKITPTHGAIFFFAIEHCNRLGWKEKFGLPTAMAMEAIGIRKWDTYSKAFKNLVEWGFIIEIEKSKNQYSSCIISIGSAYPKNGKALDKALVKHGKKHGEKQGESKGVIDIQETNKQETINTISKDIVKSTHTFFEILKEFEERKELLPEQIQMIKEMTGGILEGQELFKFYNYWVETGKSGKQRWEMQKTFELKRRLATWKSNNTSGFETTKSKQRVFGE